MGNILNKSVSESSIERLARPTQAKPIDSQLDTIKERLKKGLLRRKARNFETIERIKAHIDQV